MKEKPKALRRILNFFIFLVTFLLAACALILGGAAYFNSPPAPSTENDDAVSNEIIFEVKNGETAWSVGKRLEDAGAIRNKYFWYLLSRQGKNYIKTGTYRIELPESQINIRSQLITGEQILVKVTIPEGATLKKISIILEEEGICQAENFLAAASSREMLNNFNVPGSSMEGYLFPDTYLFNKNYPASLVVSAMADNFFKKIGIIAPDALNYGELNDRVIIASIVEREYRVPEEAPLMAGVFYNRLKIGMGLQSCATVEYVITEIQGLPHPDILYNRDLEIKSPYNTYLRPGLPPGPISAPGETSLRAAFYPAETNYLYFRLMDPGEGKHYFSSTFDDHIRAGALYLKGN